MLSIRSTSRIRGWTSIHLCPITLPRARRAAWIRSTGRQGDTVSRLGRPKLWGRRGQRTTKTRLAATGESVTEALPEVKGQGKISQRWYSAVRDHATGLYFTRLVVNALCLKSKFWTQNIGLFNYLDWLCRGTMAIWAVLGLFMGCIAWIPYHVIWHAPCYIG